ncbi:MAG: tetratricopeptide repeat protein [Bacteroidota bacterium]
MKLRLFRIFSNTFIEKNISSYMALFSSDSKNQRQLTAKAEKAMNAERYDQVIELSDRILGVNPYHEQALWLRGVAATHLEAYEEGIQYLNQLEKLDHRQVHSALYYYRGIAHMQRNAFQSALSDFDKAIAEDIFLANSYHYRGFCYAEIGEYQTAIRNLHMSEKLGPQRLDLLSLMYEVYMDLQDYPQLIRYLRKLEELDGLSPDEYIIMGWAYEQMSQPSKAVESYNWALRIQPEHPVALNNRGFSFTQMGKFESALHDFAKSIEIDPRFPYAWNNRGFTYLKMDMPEAAAEDIHHSIELDPDNAFALRNLAWCMSEQGQAEAGLPHLEKANELEPGIPLYHFIKGKILWALGLSEQAEASWRQSADLDEAEGKQQLQLLHANTSFTHEG